MSRLFRSVHSLISFGTESSLRLIQPRSVALGSLALSMATKCGRTRRGQFDR